MAGRERFKTMNPIESNMVFIDYYRKDTFGNVRYYIRPKRTAQIIKSLIGKETVSVSYTHLTLPTSDLV